MIHPTAEVSEKTKIGKNTRIWHQAQVREGVEIGENCNVGKNVYIDFNVKVGSGVKIQNNSCIYTPCEVRDDVFIGPAVIITNDKRPRAFIWDESRHTTTTKLLKGCSIGAHSVILGGTGVGEYALVGAGSVVTKNVEPHALVLGNPAKQIGWVCKCGAKTEKQFVTECGECKK